MLSTIVEGLNFKIADNKVLVECEKDKDTYDVQGFTLYKPEKYKRYAKWGWIRQIGQDVKSEAKIGDKVLFEAYSGQDLDLNGKEYKVIVIDNIHCKIE